jgi:hypothetical protein
MPLVSSLVSPLTLAYAARNTRAEYTSSFILLHTIHRCAERIRYVNLKRKIKDIIWHNKLGRTLDSGFDRESLSTGAATNPPRQKEEVRRKFPTP